ncbi:hypothetical protein HPB47_024074 [Ixodes persulcatus]|uniref:Uncharacterized protein n=1 Tax=Ixodes persulcatus TaxID=34615 RepID=A0AC60Q7G7_IXOPE|nr:hypothetical protein HPB47_024074 [Ixodes persulcatus]
MPRVLTPPTASDPEVVHIGLTLWQAGQLRAYQNTSCLITGQCSALPLPRALCSLPLPWVFVACYLCHKSRLLHPTAVSSLQRLCWACPPQLNLSDKLCQCPNLTMAEARLQGRIHEDAIKARATVFLCRTRPHSAVPFQGKESTLSSALVGESVVFQGAGMALVSLLQSQRGRNGWMRAMPCPTHPLPLLLGQAVAGACSPVPRAYPKPHPKPCPKRRRQWMIASTPHPGDVAVEGRIRGLSPDHVSGPSPEPTSRSPPPRTSVVAHFPRKSPLRHPSSSVVPASLVPAVAAHQTGGSLLSPIVGGLSLVLPSGSAVARAGPRAPTLSGAGRELQRETAHDEDRRLLPVWCAATAGTREAGTTDDGGWRSGLLRGERATTDVRAGGDRAAGSGDGPVTWSGLRLRIRPSTATSTGCEFSDWREAEQGKEHVHFLFHNGPKRPPDKDVLTRYYYCRRSGSFQSTSQGKRQLKTQGSCKTNVQCLATIQATEKDGKVTVEYQAEHYGHPKELKHQRLSTTEKEALADKLKQGIPALKVLINARSSAGSEMGRLHLLSMKDISNISVKHEILSKERRHKNQFKSVAMWVEELNKQSDSPVLYFDIEEGKEKKTFELALMTVPQRELLTKLDPKFLCIDSTHNTNGHNLQLTTLMPVAED